MVDCTIGGTRAYRSGPLARLGRREASQQSLDRRTLPARRYVRLKEFLPRQSPVKNGFQFPPGVELISLVAFAVD